MVYSRVQLYALMCYLIINLSCVLYLLSFLDPDVLYPDTHLYLDSCDEMSTPRSVLSFFPEDTYPDDTLTPVAAQGYFSLFLIFGRLFA